MLLMLSTKLSVSSVSRSSMPSAEIAERENARGVDLPHELPVLGPKSMRLETQQGMDFKGSYI